MDSCQGAGYNSGSVGLVAAFAETAAAVFPAVVNCVAVEAAAGAFVAVAPVVFAACDTADSAAVGSDAVAFGAGAVAATGAVVVVDDDAADVTVVAASAVVVAAVASEAASVGVVVGFLAARCSSGWAWPWCPPGTLGSTQMEGAVWWVRTPAGWAASRTLVAWWGERRGHGGAEPGDLHPYGPAGRPGAGLDAWRLPQLAAPTLSP